MSRYGIPYKGSKNQIAAEIVEFLPKAENLYDLFAGGCAITHKAMIEKKYRHYIINDINPMPTQLFLDALAGKYRDERRWISREDFFRLKDTDAYVKYCWSFGNDGETYLYGADIEEFKHGLHLAIYDGDTVLLERETGLAGIPRFEHISDVEKRYIAYKRYLEPRIGGGSTQDFKHLKDGPGYRLEACERGGTSRESTKDKTPARIQLQSLGATTRLNEN